MKWNCNRIYGLLLMLVVCLSACNDDDADRTMNYTEKRCRIAVLCPEEWKDNWQEIAAWALENITEGHSPKWRVFYDYRSYNLFFRL